MDGQQKQENGRSALPAVVNGKHGRETRRTQRLKHALKGWFAKSATPEIVPHPELAAEMRVLKTDFVALCQAAEKTERELLDRIADLTRRVEALAKTRPAAAKPPRMPPDCPPIADGKRKRLSGWTVRDVQNDVALIEGRNRIVEVSPGQKVRGFGQIKAIERDGASWVVVTTRGVILSETC